MWRVRGNELMVGLYNTMYYVYYLCIYEIMHSNYNYFFSFKSVVRTVGIYNAFNAVRFKRLIHQMET